MTREEEKQQAVDNFSENHKYEEGLDYLSMGIAFEEGVEWADNHPINVWHNPSDKPNRDMLFLFNDRYGYHIMTWNDGYNCNWETYVASLKVEKWAYINDLLPKNK